MAQSARTTVVLLVLALTLVIAGYLGFQRATEPFPGRAEAPKCVDTQVEAGGKVFPEDVTVSVYNASERNGLAERTMDEFTGAGFGEGDTGNAPRAAEVPYAAIWTTEPENPDVLLVASRLGPQTEVVREDGLGVGVTVLVGDEFEHLVKGRKQVSASDEATICSPPVT